MRTTPTSSTIKPLRVNLRFLRSSTTSKIQDAPQVLFSQARLDQAALLLLSALQLLHLRSLTWKDSLHHAGATNSLTSLHVKHDYLDTLTFLHSIIVYTSMNAF